MEQESSEPANRPSGIMPLTQWAKDCLLEQIPGAKPTWELLKSEGRGVRQGWVLFSAIAICLIVVTHRIDIVALSEGGHIQKISLSPDEWPPLTDEQIRSWATALAPHHIPLLAVYWGQDVEAKKFFQSLQKVGKQAGFNVEAAPGGTAGGKEFQILAPSNAPVGSVLLNLVKALNVPAKLDYQQPSEVYTQLSLFIPARQ